MRRDHPLEKFLSVAVFIALEVLSVVLISNNSTVQHTNIASAVRSVNNFFWERGNSISEYSSLRSENQKLAEENTRLRQQLDLFKTLSEMYPEADSSFSAKTGFTFISAKTVNNTVNRQHNFLILNKGSEDGVREGMGVVTSKGVVGIIAVCDKHYSKARSFLDTDLKISGKSLKDNNLGLVSWNGISAKNAVMSELPTHTLISEGDTIVTSGYSSIFPAEIPVGVVENVKSDGVSVRAKLTLFENFHSLQYVYIVSNSDMETIRDLEGKQ